MPSSFGNSMIAPWLQPQWDGIDLAACPNALLLHGQAGIGNTYFITYFFTYILHNFMFSFT